MVLNSDSAILAHLPWWDCLPPELCYPYGRLETSALADVKSLGVRVPASSALLLPAASLYMSPDILDIYLAISALQMEIGGPIRIEIGKWATSAGQTRRRLGRESMKLALRLVYLGLKAPSTVTEKRAATGCPDEANVPDQLYECLRLAALLFVWRFQRRMSATSRPMRVCHGRIASLLKSMDVKSVFMKPEAFTFGQNLLLWMLLILGTTASSTNQLQVCINLIHRDLPDRIHGNWEQVRSVCEPILWLHHESQTPAEVFWKQVTGRGLM